MNEGERPTNPAVRAAFKGCGLLFFHRLKEAAGNESMKI